MQGEATKQLLDDFGEAINRHDIDAAMEYMADDCAFESFMGPDQVGTRFEGRDAVRAGLANIWAVCPDAHFGQARNFICGDFGISEWVFTGTRDGEHIEVNGCDIFTFRDGKIALKNAFRKQRTVG